MLHATSGILVFPIFNIFHIESEYACECLFDNIYSVYISSTQTTDNITNNFTK